LWSFKEGPGPRPPDALVLVENEATVGGEFDFWGDDTGVRYHFPNQYRNLVRPGTPFVYYRGVAKAVAGQERVATELIGLSHCPKDGAPTRQGD